MTCSSGGYPTARHNKSRDLVADAMQSVFRDVEIEPQLLPYREEDLAGRTANRSEEARVDIKVRGFLDTTAGGLFRRPGHTPKGRPAVAFTSQATNGVT